MKCAKHMHRQCLEDVSGTKYFFGRHGYVEICGDVATAYITNPSAFLSDSRFGDEIARRSGKAQMLPVSPLGLRGMLEHLAVSPFADNQRDSVLYQRFKGNLSPPPQNTVIVG